MKVEIIAVGSELLLGQITNTNATFISSRLAEIGLDVYYQTVVGDNPMRLEEAIAIAEDRADILIFSGGLGPTKDDMTKETIARHVGLPLESDANALAYIQDFFKRSAREMSENNKKQALVLQGSTVLANRTGMAPGMAVEKNGHHYLLLPGPPHELQPMFEDEAIPYLLRASGKQEIIVSRVLKFYGIGEAELEHRIQEVLETQTNPTVAPLATPEAVTLRITAKAETIDRANELIDPIEQQIHNLVGEYIYGTNNDTLSSKAAELLLAKGYSIAAAESLTAGMFLADLANEPGISDVLLGGVVVYNADVKSEQLQIDKQLLEQYGVVSKECAIALASSVRRRFHADFGVGITGAAGPTGHDGEPAGTVWIAIAFHDEEPATYKLMLSGLRNANRLRAARFALYYLIQQLSEK